LLAAGLEPTAERLAQILGVDAACVRDYDEAMRPLHKLEISKSFEHVEKYVKLTKMNNVRNVPVSPTLAAILAEWKLSGWPQMIGRAPTPDNLIFPNAPVLTHSSGRPLKAQLQQAAIDRAREMAPTDIERYRMPQLGLQRFKRDCAALGLRPRRNHDCRRTLNSLLTADGARNPVLAYIVWGPGKEVSDMYTTLPWERSAARWRSCASACESRACSRCPSLLQLLRDALRDTLSKC
jgi:hypothetical protein